MEAIESHARIRAQHARDHYRRGQSELSMRAQHAQVHRRAQHASSYIRGRADNQMCTQKCVRDVRSAYSAARGSPQDVCPGGTIGARRGTELEASS